MRRGRETHRCSNRSRCLQGLVGVVLTAYMSLMSADSALAQGGPGVGAGENPWSETSRDPFQIYMSGFLNTRPEDGNIAVVTLGISRYGATYQFEILNLEAPGFPQLSTRAILQQMDRHQIDFNLIGPSTLLSKVAQSQPGTPLRLEGMYQQRGRRLQLTKVEVIGFE